MEAFLLLRVELLPPKYEGKKTSAPISRTTTMGGLHIQLSQRHTPHTPAPLPHAISRASCHALEMPIYFFFNIKFAIIMRQHGKFEIALGPFFALFFLISPLGFLK